MGSAWTSSTMNGTTTTSRGTTTYSSSSYTPQPARPISQAPQANIYNNNNNYQVSGGGGGGGSTPAATTPTAPVYDIEKDPIYIDLLKDLDELKINYDDSTKEYQDQIAGLKESLDGTTTDFNDLKILYDTQTKTYEDAKTKWDENYNSLEETVAANKAQYAEDLETSLAEQKTSYDEKFSGAQSEYQQLLAAANTAWDSKYKEQTNSFDSRFNQMVAGYDEQFADQTELYNTNLSSQKDAFNTKYDNQAKAFDTQYSNQADAFNTKYTDLSDQFAESTARYDGMIDELKIQNSKNLSNMQASFRASMQPLSQSATGIKSKKSQANVTGASSSGTKQLSRNSRNPLQITNLNI